MTLKDQIAGSFGFGTAPFSANRLDQDRAREAIKTAKAEGASREEFAKAIALYACKYNKNENVQRERIKRDGDTFDKLWRIGRARHPAARGRTE
jgi:hypothetical protein